MVFGLSGCSSTIENRNPIDRVSNVTGKTLSDVEVTLPAAWAGEPVVLLVGYLQDSQFDSIGDPWPSKPNWPVKSSKSQRFLAWFRP